MSHQLATGGTAAPSGNLGVAVIRGGRRLDAAELQNPWPLRPATLEDILDHAYPDSKLARRYGIPTAIADQINAWRYQNRRQANTIWRLARMRDKANRHGLVTVWSQLHLRVFRANGDILNLGLASARVVTTAGVNYIVDAFQNTTEVENFKYHAIGTGTNAEATGDTALQTELSTVYNPDNTRATGSQTENGSNVYRTVGTNTVDGSAAITEHGILTQAATGGGTLLDRSVFSAINLVSADSLETTYDLTLTAGG